MEWFRKRALHLGIFSIGMLLTCNVTQAQDWPKIYGNNFHAYVHKIIEDYDHGYLLGADVLANANTFRYAWIIKTDINGNELWNKKYGNGIDQNFLVSCVKTADGGLITCGHTTIEDPQFDPFFFKLNTCNEVEWCKILHSEGYNAASDIIAIEDGYIGMLKYYRSDTLYGRISLVKLSLTGDPLWIQYLAQEDSLINNEEGYYLYQTLDSNYLVSGDCFHPGMRPFWIKTNTVGNQIWDLMWTGGEGGARQVIENLKGFYYCVGGYRDTGGSMKPTLFKFDYEGNRVYHEYLLSDTIVGGGAENIVRINDSILLTGINWRTNPINVDDGYSEILMTDTLGEIHIRRVLLNENKPPQAICLSFDNKLLITGDYVVDNNWDIYLWKMNTNLEDDTIYTQPLSYDSLCPFEIQSDTVDLDCGVFVNIDELPTKEVYESTIKISPNPARDWITLTLPDVSSPGNVELDIYNVFGQKLISKVIAPLNRLILQDVAGFSSGMYVAIIKDKNNKKYTGKFVVCR